MAEPTQYSFDLSEVTLALIKHQGLHEGVWTLGFEFNLGTAIVGPSPGEVKPSAFIGINRVQLAQPPEGSPSNPFTLDAAKVNPQPSPGQQKKTKGHGR
jgi:hypothetical protein